MNVYHICILSDRSRVMLEFSHEKFHQVRKRGQVQLHFVQIGVKHIRVEAVQHRSQTDRQLDAR